MNTYTIAWPKCLKNIAPIKLNHKRLSQARAHVMQWVIDNNCGLIYEEEDTIDNGWDMALEFNYDGFNTGVAIVAINEGDKK